MQTPTNQAAPRSAPDFRVPGASLEPNWRPPQSILQGTPDTSLYNYTSNTQKVMMGATLTNLRSKLAEIEKDNWLYEAPRYTYK